ncbi:MAG: O-antigen ligase family protein, partial [Colwellia sp.]
MNIKHIHNTVVFLLSFYLLIDTFNGFLILRIGLDLKLSVVYKSLILFLIVLSLINQNLRYIIGGLSLFTILLFGEIVSIMLGDTTGDKLLFTAQHIFKLLTPLILFIYLRNLIIASPLFIHKVLRILKINCAVYLLNIFIGILGFGFSTYGGDVSDTSIGVKGFFYAGNEVSMLMVVFSAFILGKYYRVSKKLYLFWALVWIIVGFAVSTKTAMAANLILVVFIPIVIERTSLIDMSSKKFYLFASFLSCFFISIFMLVNSFIQSNIYGRLSYVFEKQGVVGLILSGRDQFLIDLMNLFFYKDSIFNLIFGNGVSFYADKLKYSTELDLP